MTPPAGLALAHRYGLPVILNGDRLRLRTTTPPPDQVVAALRADKAEILVYLKAATDLSDPATASPFLIAEHWRQHFTRLDAKIDPCSGWRGDEWRKAHGVCAAFLDPGATPSWAILAAQRGWDTLQLFGCDAKVGVSRYDRSGALLAGVHGEPVTALGDTHLRFRNGLSASRWTMDPARCVAVWNFTTVETKEAPR
jgi:hypothetical protein